MTRIEEIMRLLTEGVGTERTEALVELLAGLEAKQESTAAFVRKQVQDPPWLDKKAGVEFIETSRVTRQEADKVGVFCAETAERMTKLETEGLPAKCAKLEARIRKLETGLAELAATSRIPALVAEIRKVLGWPDTPAGRIT